MKLTLNQFRFLQRIGSNNFDSDTPTRTINSVIDLGLAKRTEPYYYQITDLGARILAEIEWTRPARYFG